MADINENNFSKIKNDLINFIKDGKDYEIKTKILEAKIGGVKIRFPFVIKRK